MREKIREINTEIKKIPGGGIVKVDETVERVVVGADGSLHTVKETKCRKQFSDNNAESLHQELRKSRSQVLRFNKRATMYINKFCE